MFSKVRALCNCLSAKSDLYRFPTETVDFPIGPHICAAVVHCSVHGGIILRAGSIREDQLSMGWKGVGDFCRSTRRSSTTKAASSNSYDICLLVPNFSLGPLACPNAYSNTLTQ